MSRASFVTRLALAAATLTVGVMLPAGHASATSADYDSGYQLGLAAYRYGLPLVTTDKTFHNQTSVNISNGRGFGPVNQFNPVRTFTTPDDRSVVAPNFDTLYSIAWLDLSDGPMVIHVPKIKDRFYVIPLMSPYTEDFANLGSVADTPAGDYAVVGPRDTGIQLPKHVTRVTSPYDRVWIIERTYADNGDPSDIAKVNKLQDEITAIPLREFPHKNWTPPAPAVPDTTIDDPGMPTGMAFYDRLSSLLAQFPPPAADQPMLDQLAQIGVGPGRTPSTDASLSADTVAGMQQAIADGPATVLHDAQVLYAQSFAGHNGYLVTPTGSYGTDYRLRAVVTQIGLGALLPDQAMYPLALLDRLGATLTGAKAYRVHIPAGGLPPVDGFWSLTMYDPSGFLVPNEINRYVINDRTNLHYNADGSLDLYLQSARPADPNQVANWLPAPAGQFRVIWRLYATQTAEIPGVLSGAGWQPPAIMPIG